MLAVAISAAIHPINSGTPRPRRVSIWLRATRASDTLNLRGIIDLANRAPVWPASFPCAMLAASLAGRQGQAHHSRPYVEAGRASAR